jgi:hypothetical protein
MQKQGFLCGVGIVLMVLSVTAAPAAAGSLDGIYVSVASVAAQSTETDDGGGGCAASYLLGNSDPRLDTLRAFRDQILSSSPSGRVLIDRYYEKSEAFIRICESHPALKYSAARMLEAVVPVAELMLPAEQ